MKENVCWELENHDMNDSDSKMQDCTFVSSVI